MMKQQAMKPNSNTTQASDETDDRKCMTTPFDEPILLLQLPLR